MFLNLFKKNKIRIVNKIVRSFLEFPEIVELQSWQIPKFEIESKTFVENNIKDDNEKINIYNKKNEPVIFLTSGIHGDEIAGNVILMKFCNYFKKHNLLKGKIIALVGVNVSGGKKLTREIAETGEDLNRLFGGKHDGTIGEKLAHKLREEIFKYKPSLVIDLHNDYFFSTPYILLDPKNLFSENLYIKTASLALSSGLNVVQERDDEREVYENSLSAHMVSKNIPSITIEGGPDKLILKKYIDEVYEALLKILYSEKMIEKPEFLKKEIRKKENKVMMNGEAVKVDTDGNMKYIIEAGEYIKEGQIIAKIYNEFGDPLKNILAPYEAYVLGHSEKISVKVGDEIYWLGKL